jgi:hypothetical protein
MAPSPDNTHQSTGYNESSTIQPTRIPRQRRRPGPTTITEVRVASVETVTMTADEEAEAVAALAVLLARYWHDHPDHAA